MVREELHLKTTTLSRVFQEISKAEGIVGSLTNECRGLRDDLQRQQALVAQNRHLQKARGPRPTLGPARPDGL